MDIIDLENQQVTIRDLDALHYIWERGIQLKPYSAFPQQRNAILAAVERKRASLHKSEPIQEETHEPTD